MIDDGGHAENGMVTMQTTIDDMNPEFCPYVAERLMAAGAHDVFWIPVLMKKGRPGLLLNVLADRSRLAVLERIVFEETTTLGIRYLDTACKGLERRSETVRTVWGGVRVKIGILEGKVVQYAPEYADCEAAAKAHGIPLKLVYEAARQAYMSGRPAES